MGTGQCSFGNDILKGLKEILVVCIVFQITFKILLHQDNITLLIKLPNMFLGISGFNKRLINISANQPI